MPASPPRRVQWRAAHLSCHAADVTITSAARRSPFLSEHGVLSKIAASDADKAARIGAKLIELVAHDAAVIDWLEASPEHTRRFMDDPVTAIREALPSLPADFFDDWSG